MTFTEAAIEVLRREGKPLHFRKLSEIAIRENLLDHVGKIPEETMADQLAAHCRLPHPERRVMPVEHGTFALIEWGLEEDATGLDALVEPPPEGELPYRGRERHPIPSRDLSRSAGRGEGGRAARRREEEERRGRRFPPPAEVAYEILAGAGKPLSIAEIAAVGAERLLMPDAFVRDGASLRAALGEDNRRRESGGRKPLFELEGDTVTLVAQPEPGERAAAPVPRAAATVQEIRRAALAGLRRRLRDCDAPTVEHVVGRLLEKLGFKDLKVAKRGREHVVCTAKRRVGIADVRHAIRIVRSGADAGRRDVVDLRRDLGHYGAQIGLVVTSGDAAREARGEAAAAGQLPVVLLCGEALAEAFAEAGVGCVPVVVPEVDETFFAAASDAAEREESARRARREEREKRDAGRREEAPASRREPPAVEVGAPAEGLEEPAPVRTIAVEVDAELREDEDEGDDEGDEEGGEGEGAEAGEGAAAAGTPGEPGGAQGADRRRRRRRRRRRGGRGRGGREGAAAGAEATGPAQPGAAQPPQEPSAPPPPSNEPSEGKG